MTHFFICIFQDKEGLITELRKELKLSYEEHKDILSGVNADDTLQRIRFFFSFFSFKIPERPHVFSIVSCCGYPMS